MRQVSNRLLLITSGTGPAECAQAVAGILPLLQAEADGMGFDIDLNVMPTKHGVRSAIAVLHGVGSNVFAQRWCGTIRWRFKSTLRPAQRRANWFIGVFPLQLNATNKIELRTSDVSFERFRAGGPRGQHQNTTDSAVRAIHRPTGMVAVAHEMRSQHRNKAQALERLGTLIQAQTVAEVNARKKDHNQFHRALERGNPVRCFAGPAFKEEGV